MSFVDSLKAWPRAKKITVAVIAGVAVAAIGVTIFLINRNSILATTMRLLKVEGTVNIEDSTGTVKPVIDNIRFTSGDTISTGSDGLASIGLDDTKIVTLQNDSSAEFIKNGKQIELKLKQGGVFFEVTEKLSDDETYEIETSNMTVGIRGTSGYVWYDESGLQSLIITDGKVVVSGYNPQTGETKTVEVCGGQKVSCYLYSDTNEDRDSVEFELTDISEEELPEFPLQMLAENSQLLDKVCKETGWDKNELLALVNAILDPDSPSPTPDEIIEITDTPTATPKSTNTPLPTVSPSPTVSPTPTNKPTSTPTAEPTNTAAPVPTVIPGSTPTVNPSGTTTPTPTTTNTTSSDSPSPTPKTTPTAETTPAVSEPTLPDGCIKFTPAWGVKNSNGDTVYICRSASASTEEDDEGEYTYFGYFDDEDYKGWDILNIRCSSTSEFNGLLYYVGDVSFIIDDDGGTYYSSTYEEGDMPYREPVPEGVPGETDPLEWTT